MVLVVLISDHPFPGRTGLVASAWGRFFNVICMPAFHSPAVGVTSAEVQSGKDTLSVFALYQLKRDSFNFAERSVEC
jgi:hypothetical protein